MVLFLLYFTVLYFIYTLYVTKVKNQFWVVDLTSEVRRKSANMKKTEARRIANAHTINQFRVVDVLSLKGFNSKF